MAFNLADYETVESRLVKFWKENPDGRIETELIEANSNRFIIMARIFRTEADSKYWTSGHAYETITDRGVNSTSALENCETSAIGRALANAGFATHGKRPSREEMTKVARNENDKAAMSITVAPVDSWETFTATMPEPVVSSTSSVLSNLKETLAAEEIPSCKHGPRDMRKGVGKTGKPWMGYMCTQTGAAGGPVKCEPIWYTYISQTGTFRAPEQTE
jgi:hypothetical protein